MNCPKTACGLALLSLLLVGCAQPAFNPHPPKSESEILTDVIQLTSGFDRAGEAYFSPDMHWIIFQATPKGEKQYQMYVLSVRWYPGSVGPPERFSGGIQRSIAGFGTPIRISPENSRNTCGYFSPNGKVLIFASTAGKEKPDEPTSGYQREGRDYRWSFPAGMEIFHADDWQAAVKTAMAGPPAPTTQPASLWRLLPPRESSALVARHVNLATHPLTNNDAYDAEGSYSPDGRWICFTSNRTGDQEIWAMRCDGSNTVQLTHSTGYDGGPFFSPDGKRIVYRSDRRSNNLLQIFVADIAFDDRGNITRIVKEHQLTHDANVNWGPYWHPDGKHIIYATSMHGHANYELYLMRSDGSRKTRITFTQGADVLPVFSPDGRYLMWTSKRTSDGTTQIFLAKFHMPKGS